MSRDEILTISDIASFLKVGGQWLFRRTAIDSWIDARTNAPSTRPANTDTNRPDASQEA